MHRVWERREDRSPSVRSLHLWQQTCRGEKQTQMEMESKKTGSSERAGNKKQWMRNTIFIFFSACRMPGSLRGEPAPVDYMSFTELLCITLADNSHQCNVLTVYFNFLTCVAFFLCALWVVLFIVGPSDLYCYSSLCLRNNKIANRVPSARPSSVFRDTCANALISLDWPGSDLGKN